MTPSLITNDQGEATNRIVAMFRSANAEELAYGLTWYQDAHTFAAEVAQRHGLTVRQVAGIIAALSPRTSWELNKVNAERLIATGDCPGLTLGRHRAQRIAFDAEDPADVLGGPKVRSFFDNLADPLNSEAVVIDRHAFDAVAGQVTNDHTRKQLDRKGEYQRVSDIYRSAAHVLGVQPHVVQAVVWSVWRNRYGRFVYQRTIANPGHLGPLTDTPEDPTF